MNDNNVPDIPVKFISWGLYPALWLWIMACVGFGVINPDRLEIVQMVKGGVTMSILFFCEWRWPYRDSWGMTVPFLFKRDLVFILMNSAVFALMSIGLPILAVFVAGFTNGPMQGQPLWLQVLIGLMVFETLQYTTHRLMHQSRGPLTNMLWRAHAVHHLPAQLYLVMHAVFHPFNAVIVRLFVQLLPLWLLGFDAIAIFIYTAVISFHGIISHFNVDLRMGWLNYLFVGPELHRYHHSAQAHEAVNYGATLSVLDQLFGTFLYKPGVPPKVLGLSEENGYPGQIDPLAAFVFAFSSSPVRRKEVPGV